jgi:hypothetical protein
MAERRRENFKAMTSPASIVLGLVAVVLVAAVCIFYDHPVLQTPQLISALHSHFAAHPL